MPEWQPYQEPLSQTLKRTGAIALAVGAVLALRWGGLSRWPVTTLMAFWPSFGGHWVELWFLNGLRHRLPASRVVQLGARFGTWFVAGIVVALGMRLTAWAWNGFWPSHWLAWWLAGLGFIGIECIAHLILYLRRFPSAFDGLG